MYFVIMNNKKYYLDIFLLYVHLKSFENYEQVPAF